MPKMFTPYMFVIEELVFSVFSGDLDFF